MVDHLNLFQIQRLPWPRENKVERGESRCSMHGIVVRERNRVGETIPISAMFREKVSPTSEDRTGESLNLTIRLRMISCCEQLSDTQDSTNVLE